MSKFTYTIRKDGRYMKRVSVNGKIKTIYSSSVKELEKKYIELKHQDTNNIFIDDQSMTVSKWAEKWFSLYKSDKEYATKRMYEQAIRLHINPYIGDIKLKNLKQSDILYMLNELDKKGITRKKDVALLTIKQILEKAVENDLIYKNVATGIKIKKHKAEEKKPLDDKVIVEIKKLAKTDFNAFMILFLIYTGLRREELVPLQYKDININKKSIIINKAICFERNQPVLKKTKNEENRIVPIFDILFEQLQELKLNHTDNDYLFPNTLGNMMSEITIKRKVSYVLKNLNKIFEPEEIKFTLHQLRHTFVCQLHKAGIDIKQAQLWTGHKDVKVLLDIYTHLDAEDNQISIDKVNKFLS